MKSTLALLVLLLWAALALGANLLPLAPDQIELSRILHGPSLAGPLGYDDLGRPLLDRLIVGARTSFLIALAVVTGAAVTGTLYGLVSGWLGGWVDTAMMRVVDVFLAFPGILLAIALAGLLGPGLDNLVLALVAVSWVGFARLARAQTLSVRQRDHVTAARALGTPVPGILLRHVLPLIAAPLLVEASFAIASVIIAEAGLSFLGLGVQPPQASWGVMIRDGTQYMLTAPHMVIVPG
ncbi:MAG: ABC transporter permease, partial [Gammaproteobacteria bacterium]|nr:ABC transporter permease [Gammaproteobacteria bacterium]